MLDCALARKALQEWQLSALCTRHWLEKGTAPKLQGSREVKSPPISGARTGNIW